MNHQSKMSQLKEAISQRGNDWFSCLDIYQHVDYSMYGLREFLNRLVDLHYLTKKKVGNKNFYQKIKEGFPKVKKGHKKGERRRSNDTYSRIKRFLQTTKRKSFRSTDVVKATKVDESTVCTFLRRSWQNGQLKRIFRNKRYYYSVCQNANFSNQAPKGEICSFVWMVLKLNKRIFLDLSEVSEKVQNIAKKSYKEISILNVLKRWYYQGILRRKHGAYRLKKTVNLRERPLCIYKR